MITEHAVINTRFCAPNSSEQALLPLQHIGQGLPAHGYFAPGHSGDRGTAGLSIRGITASPGSASLRTLMSSGRPAPASRQERCCGWSRVVQISSRWTSEACRHPAWVAGAIRQGCRGLSVRDHPLQLPVVALKELSYLRRFQQADASGVHAPSSSSHAAHCTNLSRSISASLLRWL